MVVVRDSVWTSSRLVIEGVRRCLLRYEADRGSDGRGPDWKDERRLTSGDPEAEEAGDRCEGGVYGIPNTGGL